MYCQVSIGAVACVGALASGGLLMAGVLHNSFLLLLAVSIMVGSFNLFRLWKGSRELTQ